MSIDMTDTLRAMLEEAVLHLEYLNEKEQRGTTNAVITRARAAVAAAAQPRPNPAVTNLEDELVEDVFAMSDAELESELRESGVNIELFDKDMDDLVASALNGEETP